MTTATVTRENAVHPFEKSGLGQAPFRFTHVTEKVHCVPGCAPRAGGSCDHCGTCIRYEFHILSHDGKTAKVGCDCILKLNREDNQLYTAVKREKLNIERKQREARAKVKREKENTRIKAATAMLESKKALLAGLPHPNEYFASTGKTLYDYAEFLLKCCGQSGRLRGRKLWRKFNAGG